MNYISICSGIEAATVAWHPLGWKPLAFSEIEKFPSAILASHYPDVPNMGDMTGHDDWKIDDAVDLLVGGTPCQDFSIAGLRAGLVGERGNLSLEFGRIAAKFRPRWLVWENVPGVLSSNAGQDFATILGLFSGQIVECPTDSWGNFGIVPGYRNAYGLAWRVLDAQYVRVDGFGRAVPQRRRRLFIVGYLGDWRRAAAVLFEPEGLRRDTPPRREAGKSVAPTISARTKGGGGLGTDFDCDGGLVTFDRQSSGEYGNALTASTVSARDYKSASDLVAQAYRTAGDGCVYDEGSVTAPLTTGTDSSANIVAIQERAISENPNAGPDGKGFRDDGAAYTIEARSVPQSVAYPYTLAIRGRADGYNLEARQDGTANAILTPNGGRAGIGVGAIALPWAVRRLTPRECERLQGFPDDYTLIEVRGKPAADGPRYKALGNSMAVNCMRWLGRRIQMVERT